MEKEEMKKRIRSGYVDMYESQTTDEDIQKGSWKRWPLTEMMSPTNC